MAWGTWGKGGRAWRQPRRLQEAREGPEGATKVATAEDGAWEAETPRMSAFRSTCEQVSMRVRQKLRTSVVRIREWHRRHPAKRPYAVSSPENFWRCGALQHAPCQTARRRRAVSRQHTGFKNAHFGTETGERGFGHLGPVPVLE